jgi:hypothetical protein
VNESRNTNASLFLTTLCACLSLLVVGTPLQAQAKLPATERNQSAYSSTIRSGFGASVVASLQKLKIEDQWLPDSVAEVKGQPEKVLYRNARALIENNHILLITHLPRAALSDSPCETA